MSAATSGKTTPRDIERAVAGYLECGYSLIRSLLSLDEIDGLIVSPDELETATIRGNLKEFILLASRSEDPDSLFFQRRLMIEGDTEVGLEIKNLMDAVDHDSLPPLLKLILTRGTPLLQKLIG